MILATALSFVLLFTVPAEALWRDWRRKPVRSQALRFGLTIVKALALLVALLLVARSEGIAAADLGVGAIGTGGYVGLAVAVLVVAGITVAALFAKPDPEKARKHSADGLMPEGPQERRLFFVTVPLIGFAWELLYRGYLLWWLTPRIGLPLAVVCASLSYGLAHGWKSFREGMGSLVAALAFTLGYALTGSLWWLILLHICLPLVGFLALSRASLSARASPSSEAIPSSPAAD